MLIVETIARIRRDHLDRGKSIKKIARELNLSRNTVRRVLRSGETALVYEREVQPRPKLGVWTQDLERLLMTNSTAASRERLTLIRIFEELRGQGYRTRRRVGTSRRPKMPWWSGITPRRASVISTFCAGGSCQASPKTPRRLVARSTQERKPSQPRRCSEMHLQNADASSRPMPSMSGYQRKAANNPMPSPGRTAIRIMHAP